MCCPVCEKSDFKFPVEMSQHIFHAHEEQSVKSAQAKRKLKQQQDLQKEAVRPTATSSVPLHCSCGITFTKMVSWQSHVAAHHVRYRCLADPTCDVVVNGRNALEKHTAEAHPEASFFEPCAECLPYATVKFTSASVRGLHKKYHASNLCVTCPHCGQTMLMHIFLQHLQQHHPEEEALCPFPDCEEDFDIEHMRSEHFVAERTVDCPHCSRWTEIRFLDQKSLQSHRKLCELDPHQFDCPFDGCDAKLNATYIGVHIAKQHIVKKDTPVVVSCAVSGCSKTWHPSDAVRNILRKHLREIHGVQTQEAKAAANKKRVRSSSTPVVHDFVVPEENNQATNEEQPKQRSRPAPLVLGNSDDDFVPDSNSRSRPIPSRINTRSSRPVQQSETNLNDDFQHLRPRMNKSLLEVNSDDDLQSPRPKTKKVQPEANSDEDFQPSRPNKRPRSLSSSSNPKRRRTQSLSKPKTRKSTDGQAIQPT